MSQSTPQDNNLFVQLEKQTLDFWDQNNVYASIQAQYQHAKPYWYYDGPPFATGLPHHGHLLASTIKDVVPRYYEMQGYKVPRQFGWDCHGLPIEHEIDKSLGLSSQQAVATLGLAGYNQACRDIVQRYTSQWHSSLKRMGRWLDFSKPYKTMDTPFMESVWWAIGQLFDNDLLYQGEKVVPYSTVLQTGLSNFEATSNYQSVQSPSIQVLLPLTDENCCLAIWTTTPWTLPSNLAVCVGNHTYVQVKHPDHKAPIIVAKACIKNLADASNYIIERELSASDLVGRRYQPLFDYAISQDKNAYTVMLDDYVSVEDGTGLVHMAAAHGEDDYRVCKAHGMSPICLVDAAGCFAEDLSGIGGMLFTDANKTIIQTLKQRGLLLSQNTIEHNYPFCPRSDTPLMYRTVPSWYVNVSKIKEKLLAANQSIRWVPGHIQHGRFGKWLEGAKDWAISRNRYWGTPIPIWVNDESGKCLCIDSISTLQKLSGQTPSDLHSDVVDAITFSLPGEKGTYKRIPDVLDCWFESGCVPFAQWHYPFENQEFFHSLFPAAFISEGIDQTRGWFYTLTVLAVALFDKPAFHNVIVSGIVMAEDGKKMSKRLKNYTAPDLLMDTYGADALRLYLLQSNLVRAEEMRFSDQGVRDITRRVQIPWWNALKFFSTYADIDAWNVHDYPTNDHQPDNVLDAWILSRLQSFISHMHAAFSVYELHTLVASACQFLDDVTNTYIRLNRARFWQSGMPKDKLQAYATLHTVLLQFSTAMAPLAPFLSESVYQKLKKYEKNGKASIHMQSYPKTQPAHQQPSLEQAVTRMQQVLIMGRQVRNDARIKIKTPLKTLHLIHAHPEALADIQPLLGYLQDELNVKHVEVSSDEETYITLSAKLNAAKLGLVLGKATGQVHKTIGSWDQATIRAYEQQPTAQVLGHDLQGDDVIVTRRAKDGSDAVSLASITMRLDTTLNQDLIDEGYAREIVSYVQKARKESGFLVSDRIRMRWQANQALSALLHRFQDKIKHEVLCTDLSVHDADETPTSQAPAMQSTANTTAPGHRFTLDALQGMVVLEQLP